MNKKFGFLFIFMGVIAHETSLAEQFELAQCGVSVKFSGSATVLPEDQSRSYIRQLFPSGTTANSSFDIVGHSTAILGNPFQEIAMCLCDKGPATASLKSEISRTDRWSVRVGGIGAGKQSPVLDWPVPGFNDLKTISRMLLIGSREGCFIHQQVNASAEQIIEASGRFLNSLLALPSPKNN